MAQKIGGGIKCRDILRQKWSSDQMYYLLQLYQGLTGYEGEEQYGIKTVSERLY